MFPWLTARWCQHAIFRPKELIPSLLATSDVLGTGWFAADAANVKPGKTAVVVGDGAVGLLAVLSAKQMGAERIIAMSRHESRQKLAREFGATDIVTERGEEGVARIKELTNGIGADSVLECVGTQESMLQAIRSTRPGGFVSYVGVPHGVELDGKHCSSLKSICTAAQRRFAGTSLTSLIWCLTRRSIPAKCSIWCYRSSRWPRAIERWTNAGLSRQCCSRKGPENMEIKRVGTQASAKGPSDWFTGSVRIDPLFQAPDPAFVQGASVTFEPGARTAWHTHPLGQTLIVTAGCGWAQRDGGAVEVLHPGDVVWFSPGEKHWHGATTTTGMTHIAIQEKLDGKVVEWLEHVTDEQYRYEEKQASKPGNL